MSSCGILYHLVNKKWTKNGQKMDRDTKRNSKILNSANNIS